jgi:hypothetical protein
MSGPSAVPQLADPLRATRKSAKVGQLPTNLQRRPTRTIITARPGPRLSSLPIATARTVSEDEQLRTLLCPWYPRRLPQDEWRSATGLRRAAESTRLKVFATYARPRVFDWPLACASGFVSGGFKYQPRNDLRMGDHLFGLQSPALRDVQEFGKPVRHQIWPDDAPKNPPQIRAPALIFKRCYPLKQPRLARN